MLHRGLRMSTVVAYRADPRRLHDGPAVRVDGAKLAQGFVASIRRAAQVDSGPVHLVQL